MEKQPPILPPFQFYLHKKPLTLYEDKFHKSIVTHFTVSGSASYNTLSWSKTDNKHLKECQRALKGQDRFSTLSFSLETANHIESKFLLPMMQQFSSLSSLSLRFHRSSQIPLIPQVVPFKILISLKQVSHLDLSFVSISIEDAQILKKLMKTVRKLRRLDSLSLTFDLCKSLTSSHYDIILSNITKITKLRKLKLHFGFCKSLLLIDNIEKFASALPKLSLLTRIDLSFQRVTTIQPLTLLMLFKTFQSLKNLKELALDFGACQIDDDKEQTVSMREALKCLVGTSVQKLSFSLYKNFSPSHLEDLSEALKELIHLQSLSLGQKNPYMILPEDVSIFGSALACLISLTSLSLNFVIGKKNKSFVQTITSALTSLHNLVSLKLNLTLSDDFEDHQFQSLFTNFRNLKALKYLHIQIEDEETITDTSLEALGESLKELSLLKGFSLNFSVIFLSQIKALKPLSLGSKKAFQTYLA